jgi:hypothetical protein
MNMSVLYFISLNNEGMTEGKKNGNLQGYKIIFYSRQQVTK